MRPSGWIIGKEVRIPGASRLSLRPAPCGEGQEVVTTPKEHSRYPISAAPLWRRPGKAVTPFGNSLTFFAYLILMETCLFSPYLICLSLTEVLPRLQEPIMDVSRPSIPSSPYPPLSRSLFTRLSQQLRSLSPSSPPTSPVKHSIPPFSTTSCPALPTKTRQRLEGGKCLGDVD